MPWFCCLCCLPLHVSHDTNHRVQRSNHGSAQDELADLRERHALLQSSGIDVDFSTRVDHLNDRRIARHQTWSKIGTQVSVGSTLEDQILAASAKDITQPQRQLLQLGVAQVRPTAAMGARVCVSRCTYQLLLLDLCWHLNRRLDLSVPRITSSSCVLGWLIFGHLIVVKVSLNCALFSLTWF